MNIRMGRMGGWNRVQPLTLCGGLMPRMQSDQPKRHRIASMKVARRSKPDPTSHSFLD